MYLCARVCVSVCVHLLFVAFLLSQSSKPIDLASYYHWSRLVIIAIITLALYYSVTIEVSLTWEVWSLRRVADLSRCFQLCMCLYVKCLHQSLASDPTKA